MTQALTPIYKCIDTLERETPQGVVLVAALQAFVGVAGADKSPFDRLLTFFTAQIRNKNTREAYGRAVRDFFAWCTDNEIGELVDIEPVHIGAYIEQLAHQNPHPQSNNTWPRLNASLIGS